MTDGQHWSDVARDDAVRHAVGRAARAPSVHNTQPWQIRVAGDSVAVRADRTRQLLVADRRGRELVMSTGAALLNLRVGLAARAWGAEVHRMPDRDDPDLAAVVRVLPIPPEVELAPLDPAVTRRRTNRGASGRSSFPMSSSGDCRARRPRRTPSWCRCSRRNTVAWSRGCPPRPTAGRTPTPPTAPSCAGGRGVRQPVVTAFPRRSCPASRDPPGTGRSPSATSTRQESVGSHPRRTPVRSR